MSQEKIIEFFRDQFQSQRKTDPQSKKELTETVHAQMFQPISCKFSFNINGIKLLGYFKNPRFCRINSLLTHWKAEFGLLPSYWAFSIRTIWIPDMGENTCY